MNHIKMEGVLPDSFTLPQFVVSKTGMIHEVHARTDDYEVVKMACYSKLLNPFVIRLITDEEHAKLEGRARMGVMRDVDVEGLRTCPKCRLANPEGFKPFLDARDESIKYIAAVEEKWRLEREERERVDAVRYKMNELIETALVEMQDLPMSELNIDFGKVTLRDFLATMQNCKMHRRWELPREWTAIDLARLIDG